MALWYGEMMMAWLTGLSTCGKSTTPMAVCTTTTWVLALLVQRNAMTQLRVKSCGLQRYLKTSATTRHVVGGGKIFGQQNDGSTTTGRAAGVTNFRCWDAFTGQTLWNLGVNPASPVLAYGCLYLNFASFFGTGGYLVCISTAVTSQNWIEWRGNTAQPGVTYNFAPRDLSGGPQWTFTTGGGLISSPVIANGKLYIGDNSKTIWCLDAYSGQEIWNWSFPATDTFMTHFGSTLAVLGSEVIVGPDDGNVYALNANTGAKLWSVSTGPYVPLEVSLGQDELRSSPIIYDGNIYVGSNGGNFYCISSSGTVLWAYNTGGPIISSAAIWNNTVYVPTWGSGAPGINDANNVFEFNPTTGAVLFNFTTYKSFGRVTGGAFGTLFGFSPCYTPVVTDPGVLYIGTQTANMAAYNVTSGELMCAAEQPYVLGENSCGSPVYVPTAEGGEVFCQAGPAMDA